MKVDRNAKNPVINSYALILMRTGSPSKSFSRGGPSMRSVPRNIAKGVSPNGFIDPWPLQSPSHPARLAALPSGAPTP
jgi:hypothetical protein